MMKLILPFILSFAASTVLTSLTWADDASSSSKQPPSANSLSPFHVMSLHASRCMQSGASAQSCYRQAFPRRCRNFSRQIARHYSPIAEQKLQNCVNSCDQATYLSRKIGACSSQTSLQLAVQP